MKTIITEEMRFRQRLCEYAMKHGVTKAALHYNTYRQFVYRQLKKYDGTVQSLALKSRKPKNSPNAHTKEELKLIKKMYKKYGNYGLAEVFVRCRSRGYTRSFESMCRQIRKYNYKPKKKMRKSYTRYVNLKGEFPGDKVQVDIKYVPEQCIRFPSYGDKYYQITAIDEYSRKRVLKVVKEKSTYETSKFAADLEKEFGFTIKTIQTDNGSEFVNDPDKTDKISAFEQKLQQLHISHKRTRPYSPWQNGKVERSHREDGKIFYDKEIFRSEKELIEKLAKHQKKYNNTAKVVLGFKSPNQIVSEYFSNM